MPRKLCVQVFFFLLFFLLSSIKFHFLQEILMTITTSAVVCPYDVLSLPHFNYMLVSISHLSGFPKGLEGFRHNPLSSSNVMLNT